MPNLNLLDDVNLLSHEATCRHCGVLVSVPMSRTRLERGPWRIVWRCHVCGRLSRTLCPTELVGLFAGWDRVGGMCLSMREVAALVKTDLDVLNRAVVDELL